MGLRAKDIVLTESAAGALERLETSSNPSHLSVARRARALRPVLLADCPHGEVVRKELIPKVLRERYGVENLFVEDLPSFWRVLYTIVRDRGQRFIVIVEIVDHRQYDRWFPGRVR